MIAITAVLVLAAAVHGRAHLRRLPPTGRRAPLAGGGHLDELGARPSAPSASSTQPRTAPASARQRAGDEHARDEHARDEHAGDDAGDRCPGSGEGRHRERAAARRPTPPGCSAYNAKLLSAKAGTVTINFSEHLAASNTT